MNDNKELVDFYKSSEDISGRDLESPESRLIKPVLMNRILSEIELLYNEEGRNNAIQKTLVENLEDTSYKLCTKE